MPVRIWHGTPISVRNPCEALMKEEFQSYFGELSDTIYSKLALRKKGEQVIQLVKEKKYRNFKRDMRMLTEWCTNYGKLVSGTFVQFLKKEEVIHVLINDIFDFFIAESQKDELEKAQRLLSLRNPMKAISDFKPVESNIKRITKTTALETYSTGYINYFPFFASVKNPHYSQSLMYLFFTNILSDICELIQKRYEYLGTITLRGKLKEEYDTLKHFRVDKFKKQSKDNSEVSQATQDKKNQPEDLYPNYLEKFDFFQMHRGEILDAQAKKVYFFLGETNSGKTHTALSYIKPDMEVAYLAPLRLLAIEVYEKMNAKGIPCSLHTGEEEILVPGAKMIAGTLEMLGEQHYDLVIVDEYQMIEDSQRGSAVTRAILSSRCERLFLIGSPNYLNTTLSFMGKVESFYNQSLFDCEAHYFQRQSQITFHDDQLDPSKYQRGDCIVCFSKRRIYEINDELNNRGYSTAILYGDLPLETRREQSELYHRGDVDILIASDVIGMGLNLPIKRLIFDSVSKFDGEYFRRLTEQEFKQIAGRAGRGKENGEIFLGRPSYASDDDDFDGYFFDNRARYAQMDVSEYHSLILERSVTDINNRFNIAKNKYQSDLPLFEKCFNSIKIAKNRALDGSDLSFRLKFDVNANLLDEFSFKFTLNYSDTVKQYFHFAQEVINSENELDIPQIKGLSINKQVFAPFIELMDEERCGTLLPDVYQKPSKIFRLACAPCNLFNNKSHYEEYFDHIFDTKRFRNFLSQTIGIKSIPAHLNKLELYKQRETLTDPTLFTETVDFRRLYNAPRIKRHFGDPSTSQAVSDLGSYYLNFALYGFDDELLKCEIQSLRFIMSDVKGTIIHAKAFLRSASNNIERIKELVTTFNINRIMNIVPHLEKKMILLSWLNKSFYFMHPDKMRELRTDFGQELHTLISISNRFIPKLKIYIQSYRHEEYLSSLTMRRLKIALKFKSTPEKDILKGNKNKLNESLKYAQMSREQLLALRARDKVELTKELQQEEAIVKEKMAKWQQAHYQLIQSILDECELK